MSNKFEFNIGRFQCVAINDGHYSGNAGLLFSNAPQDDLQQALARYGEVAEILLSTWTCLLIQTESSSVLVDTGGGQAFSGGGKLMPTLQEIGCSPTDIDLVILTHIHGDHIWGCLNRNDEIAFPRATFVMGKDEWTYWTTEDNLKSAPEWVANTVEKVLPKVSEKLNLISGAGTVIPGIKVLPAPGHTYGHIAVEIESAGERLLYLADTALHPIHIEYPHWTATVDQFPEITVQTRLEIYERAANQKTLALLFHFHPFPSLGYIVKDKHTYRWKKLSSIMNP